MALHLRHYRFGYDDGTEAAHTWRGLEDTAVVIEPGVPFLLRFAVWEEDAVAFANVAQQFQVRLNAGAWQDVTTTSTICQAVAVSAFTNGQHCTRRLTEKPVGTFEASGAGCTEDGSSGGNQNDITANGYSETEAGLQLVAADVVTGDTVEFRLTVAYTGGTSITCDVTASATANEPSASESRSSSTSASASASLSASASASASASPSGEDILSQFARPAVDISDGTWTASVGSDLAAMLDEVDPDDADYVTSAVTPNDDTCKMTLVGITAPTAGTVTFRIRGRWVGGYGGTNTVYWVWEAVPSATDYILRVGSGSGLSDVYESHTGNVLVKSLALTSGTYYGRVAAIVGGVEQSPTADQVVTV